MQVNSFGHRAPNLLRIAAVATALTAIVDPSCTRMREVPLPVRVESATADAADRALAERVRTSLASALPLRIDVDSPEAPAAIVLVGDSPGLGELPDGIPVSVVRAASRERRNVRVVHVSSPRVMLPGLTGRITATVQAVDAAGERAIISLEQDSIELGRVEHEWQRGAESFEASFEYVPPAPVAHPLRIVVHPIERETTVADNHADLRLAIEDRRLEVLVYEPRPSWTTAFVRRTLEEDPLFEVAAFSRPSRGVEVRAGLAPDRLRRDSLEPFDAIVVGAPEELDQEEIDALNWFARTRGGTFLLAPDRRPSGAYVRMIPVASFEETLLESPSSVAASGAALRGSEFAVARKPGPAVRTIADLTAGRTGPVVFEWPEGVGTGVFVGALDAWRHRARDEFSAFWRAQVAAAAAASPRRVEASLDPAIVAPGGSVTLSVRIRATEIDLQEAVQYPVAAARVIRPDGSTEPIRLWPAAEAGVFEARFEAPGEGKYMVQAAAGAVTVDTPLVVSAGARSARSDAPASLDLLAATTGGVAVAVSDLSPLIAHLDELPARTAAESVHPARSPWWMAFFVLLLCAEWGIRRRRGLS